MRLTLRTLLAYLDDTLEPSEAKQLGAKLAESEPAREIVERIKDVIRRRRLTVPPASSRLDANTIAEYLDNEIGPDQAEELERICLASNVHLAEVAACHQILSLVLGEAPPAPENAIQRMIQLGDGKMGGKKGPAGLGVKKSRPTSKAEVLVPHDRDADDTLRMGLPPFWKKDRLSQAMMIVGGCLVALLLVVAVWNLLKPPPTPSDEPVDEKTAQLEPAKKIELPPTPKPVSEVKTPVEKTEPVEKTTKKLEPSPEPIKVEPKEVPKTTPEPKVPEEKGKEAKGKEEKGPFSNLPPPVFGADGEGKIESQLVKAPLPPPSPVVAPIGKLQPGAKDVPAILLEKASTAREWKRVSLKDPDVQSSHQLLALPGSQASILVEKGVLLTLWGNMTEEVPAPPIHETLVEWFEHETLDLDLSLKRGRVLITSRKEKGPALVRLRFDNPNDAKGTELYWLLTLKDKGSEVLIDRWSMIPPGEPYFKNPGDPQRQGPMATMAAIAVKGAILLKTPTESFTLAPPPSAALVIWQSRTGKLEHPSLPVLPAWLTAPAPSAEVVQARKDLDAALTDKKVDVGLIELLKAPAPMSRRLAVRCLGAMDDPASLLDLLNAQTKADQRSASIDTLAHWLALSRDNDGKLADMLKPRFKGHEPEILITLLHGFSEQAAQQPATYEVLISFLQHPQLAVREAAWWNLVRLAPVGKHIPYDAADAAKRDQAVRTWQKLIPPGKLPPPAPSSPPPPAEKAKISRTDEHDGDLPLIRDGSLQTSGRRRETLSAASERRPLATTG